jgi:hypothetical protein
MPKPTSTNPRPTREAGFALILAILALLLLTFLGLTMAVTTSTELQIAQNYRFSQQALYNAEAGVEVGKLALRGLNWDAILPSARTTSYWDGVTAPAVKGGGATAPFSRADVWGNPSRNFENWQCDNKDNGTGYGVVLDDGSAAAPYQYLTTYSGQTLNGAVTIWVRRLRQPRGADGLFQDYPNADALVLVAEGIAPYAGGSATTSFAQNRQSVQVIEVTLALASATNTGNCGNRSGQAAGSQLGANFGGCNGITGGAGITSGMVGGTNSSGGAVGSGIELNPNQ